MIHGELMTYWGYDFDMASDGIEATKIIRCVAEYFPIMAFTSNESYKKACYAAGMDAFAQKPCLPDELFAKINELSVKLFKFIVKPDGFDIKEVMPMDQQHAQELRKLKSQGLIKMRLDGPDNRELIAHKNTPNKISHDFNILRYSMTEFLNRDPDRPTVVDLYRGTKNCIIETFVDEEGYQEKLATEDEMMNAYLTKKYKSDEEWNKFSTR
jgi:CheY-like chemotaxis protein